MARRRKFHGSWDKIKPGQFHCYIKQCTAKDCENWFIGAPASRYCDECKPRQYAQARAGWQRKFRDTGKAPGHPSRFSEEEIKEMREMFHKQPVSEIAAHFNCRPSLIYKWQKRDPQNYRV